MSNGDSGQESDVFKIPGNISALNSKADGIKVDYEGVGPHAIPRPVPLSRLEPVGTSEADKSLIVAGISLHERGEYGKAIQKYLEVLSHNPRDVWALYELSFSYFRMGIIVTRSQLPTKAFVTNHHFL